MFRFLEEFNTIEDKNMKLEIIEKFEGDDAMLPFYYWNILVDNVEVGKISLRIGKNFHSYYNGNIGYEINKEFRGNNYAYKACLMILPIAKIHNMTDLILSCSESNVASYKTIEKLGAKLIEIVEIPKEYFAYREGMERQRIYRLTT